MLNATQFNILGLIFVRITALLATAPLLRSRSIPVIAKGGLSLMLAWVLLPTVAADIAFPANVWVLAFFIGREVLIGLSIGFLVQLFFFAVQAAGQLIDTEMGFQMANVLDPLAESQLPLIGNLFSMVSLLLYLSLDGHLFLIRALADSFVLLPLGSPLFPRDIGLLVSACAQVLGLAVKIALPIIGVSLFTSLMFGIMARSVPQMNVFIVGMPLKIIILSLVLIIVLPGLVFCLEKGLGDVFWQVSRWLASSGSP